MPTLPTLPAWDRFQGEPHSFSNLAGTVYFHFDMEAFDFHLDVAPNADPKDVCNAITQAEWWGLEVLDDDECEPELLEGGRVRRYLTPIVPAEIVEAEAIAELIQVAEVIAIAEAITEPIAVVAGPKPAEPVPAEVKRFASRHKAHMKRVKQLAAVAGLACSFVLQFESAPHHDRAYRAAETYRAVQTQIVDMRRETKQENPAREERGDLVPGAGEPA